MKAISGISVVINTHLTAYTVALRHVNWLQQIESSVQIIIVITLLIK